MTDYRDVPYSGREAALLDLGAFLALAIVLLEELAPVGVLFGIGLDRSIAALVLLFAVDLTVQGMAAVHRIPALLAQPLRPLRLLLDDPGRADPRTVDDLPYPLPRDPEFSPCSLQVVQLLIPRDYLIWVGLAARYEIVGFAH